jgi:hypothetical protein
MTGIDPVLAEQCSHLRFLLAMASESLGVLVGIHQIR